MMKNKLFFILLAVVLTNVGTVSCSHNDTFDNSSKTEVLKNRTRDLDQLRNIHNDMIRSKSYIKYQINIENMVTQLKGVDSPPLGNRVDFSAWITAELRNTNFNSVEEAMFHYDVTVVSYTDFLNENSLFFEEIEELSDDDYRFVIKDGFTPSPGAGMNVTTACQDNCMDIVSAELDRIDNTRITPKRWYAWAIVGFYDRSAAINNAVSEFNDCMNAC